MTPNSSLSSLLLSLYSSFNSIQLSRERNGITKNQRVVMESMQDSIQLNGVQSRVSEATINSLSTVQTIVAILFPLNPSCTAFPPSLFLRFPSPIWTLSLKLKRSAISNPYTTPSTRRRRFCAIPLFPHPSRRRCLPNGRCTCCSMPTDSITRSCPARLLPYLHHHFTVEPSFDTFCCSPLILGSAESKQVPEWMLVRGFIEEKEMEDGIDDNEICEIEQMSEENRNVEQIEIEVEEEEVHHPTQFELFPRITVWKDSKSLNEDLVLFIRQIPAYRTYSN